MKPLAKLIQQLEEKIGQQQAINLAISNTQVGWHIEHALVTIDVIVGAVAKSNPDDYKWKWNNTKVLIFAIKKIPRGRVQAPKLVQPQAGFTPETLRQHAALTLSKIEALTTLQPNNYFVHPMFGKLNLKATTQFLQIHTTHHLKIITDILK